MTSDTVHARPSRFHRFHRNSPCHLCRRCLHTFILLGLPPLVWTGRACREPRSRRGATLGSEVAAGSIEHPTIYHPAITQFQGRPLIPIQHPIVHPLVYPIIHSYSQALIPWIYEANWMIHCPIPPCPKNRPRPYHDYYLLNVFVPSEWTKTLAIHCEFDLRFQDLECLGIYGLWFLGFVVFESLKEL